MFTDSHNRPLTEIALNGATMGTRYSATLFVPADLDIDALEASLFDAVNRVDCQMSTWKPDSDLMRVNNAKVDDWVNIPNELATVLAKSIDIGRASGGAFDIGVGDLVNAWGFGAENETASPDAITALLRKPRKAAHEVLDLDLAGGRVRKKEPITLDLSGIAKGFGVDEMTRSMKEAGIKHALLSLDGELRAIGVQPSGEAWSVAIEKPDYDIRAPYSVITLDGGALATSGDYRHWIDVGQSRFSHTMNGKFGGPLQNKVASATVLAAECMEADAWATVMLVLGETAAVALAEVHHINALLIIRDGSNLREVAAGPVFNG